MSGPKTSVLSPNFMYYKALTESAKASWAETEILYALRAMQACEQKISELTEQIRHLLGDCTPSERIQNLLEAAQACSEVSFDDIDIDHKFSTKELRNIQSTGAIDVSYSDWSALMDTQLEGKYLEYFQSIRDLPLQQKTNVARACAAKAAKMETMVRKLQITQTDLEASIKEQIFSQSIGTSFYIPFRNIRNRNGSEEIIRKINDALLQVSAMMLTDTMLEQLNVLKEKAAEITDASYLSNFYQLVVHPYVEACTQYDAFYQAHFAEYKEYRTSYEILCGELKLIPQQLEFSADAISFYQAQTVVLQEQLIKRHVRESVLNTVNQVMAELGYDLVASRDVVRKSGKQFHDELYLYGEGTAISVVHSSDGQLTMEIGGLDHGDRAPTEAEARNMSAQMTSFCLDYAAIAEALKKKGLDMKTVTMLPPDAQYATIINLDDYEVQGHVKTISDVKETKKRTANTQKRKHAEDQ